MQVQEETMRSYSIASGRRSGEGPYALGQLRTLYHSGELGLDDALVSDRGESATARTLKLHWPLRPWMLIGFLLVGIPGLALLLSLFLGV
jgi:hypothetical protein